MLFQPGVLSIAWGCAIRKLAAGLGTSTSIRIAESYEREPAPEAFDIAAGRIPKGGVAALHFEISGMVDGHPVIVVEHVTRLAGRPASGLGAARPARRVLPGGDHR